VIAALKALRHPKSALKITVSEDETMHDVAKHDDSKGQYFWVWGALLVLTGVEVWLGYRQIFDRCVCWRRC